MEPVGLSGFVLDAFSLSAGRTVVTVFTRERGMQKGVWRIGKKGPHAYVGPLNHISFQLSGKEHQSLRHMKEVSLDQHHYDLASSYHGLIALQHWAFLIRKSQPEGQEDERVYRLLAHVLPQGVPKRRELLCRTLYLEAWLLHFCGVLPKSDHPENAHSVESRLAHSLDPEFKRAIFQRKIEDFNDYALKLGALTQPCGGLGTMWERFLSGDLKTRTLLLEQLQERRDP